VGGRIQFFQKAWLQSTSDSWVLEIVSQGYSLEFTQLPLFRGVISTPLHKGLGKEIILEEVQTLLKKQAIEPVPREQEEDGFYSTFFLVPKKDKGLRPILNLRPLNNLIVKRSFKMENLRSVKKAVNPEDWLVALDLQDAYMHIPIHRNFRKYLRFKIGAQAYQFKVLPFGLSSAPRVFTKVLAPLVALARREGMHIFPYLDDWLQKLPTSRPLMIMLQRLIEILVSHGFLINIPKSVLDPTQSLVFIGGHFQTDRNLVSLPQEREEKLLTALKSFKLGGTVSARQFLQLLGIMAAMIEVVMHCRLRMRPVQMYLMAFWSLKSKDLSALIPVNHILLQHLLWWKKRENLRQGIPLRVDPPELVITTDASSLHGWGGHLGHAGVQGKWEAQMRDKHINILEMEAVFRTCQHFQDQLKNKSVLVKCDNSTVVSYVNKEGGTRSPSLGMLTWKLLIWAQERKIVLTAEHLPGVQNQVADRLSREFVSPLEWRLNPAVVQRVFLRWGVPLIDLFASVENRQTQVFCSRLPDPQAFQTDALSLIWDNLFGYAFPPISLIPLILDKIEMSRCSIIMVAPMWPRRSWFPRLLELSVGIPLLLPVLPDLLTQDRGWLHHPNPGMFRLVAWNLSADALSVRDFRATLLTHYNSQSGVARLNSTNDSGVSLFAGATHGKLIPLQLL